MLCGTCEACTSINGDRLAHIDFCAAWACCTAWAAVHHGLAVPHGLAGQHDNGVLSTIPSPVPSPGLPSAPDTCVHTFYVATWAYRGASVHATHTREVLPCMRGLLPTLILLSRCPCVPRSSGMPLCSSVFRRALHRSCRAPPCMQAPMHARQAVHRHRQPDGPKHGMRPSRPSISASMRAAVATDLKLFALLLLLFRLHLLGVFVWRCCRFQFLLEFLGSCLETLNSGSQRFA